MTVLTDWELLAIHRLTEPTPLFDKIVEVARARLAEDGLLSATPPAQHSAYILGLMDYKTHKLNGVGIYSENEGTITHLQPLPHHRHALPAQRLRVGLA